MNTSIRILGERLRRLSGEEDAEVSAEQGKPAQRLSYPFGGKDGYIAWLKERGMWFNVEVSQ